ncbi:epimerase [Anditalea andensis]|uniref:Epimerase n=2 Tax=Anditalea andensis TaxID=1048983 RepID=A0A074KXF3_9BACT|nr:epimerase [Anditalea andensis]
MNKPRVSIIGYGWLGEPLASYLKEKGFPVKGSTTTSEKLNKLTDTGLETYLLKFSPHPIGRAFQNLFDTDILFINIPPARRSQPDSFHPEQIKYIKAMAIQYRIPKIIYTSATSVYPDNNQRATEANTINVYDNPALYNAEQILRKEKTYDLTVIRYGGLLGVDRIPGRYFSGKENVTGDTPVNYIHRDDAVALAAWIIENRLWNETFNGVAPLHPQRKDIYEKNAAEMGFSSPISYAKIGESKWKEVSSAKIIATGFKFKFPDPMDFGYTLSK